MSTLQGGTSASVITQGSIRSNRSTTEASPIQRLLKETARIQAIPEVTPPEIEYDVESAVEGIQDEVSSAKRTLHKRRENTWVQCLKHALLFILSRVGLTIIVGAYSVMGGFLFQYLEGESEKLQRVAVTFRRSRAVARLWNVTVDLNVLFERNWSIIANDILKDFQDEVVTALKVKGWDGREDENADVQWSFPGALLFSVTVLTTIGYGHIVPKTVAGRIATMLYATLGIPFTLLWISILGISWANCFRFCFKKCCDFFSRYRSMSTLSKQIYRSGGSDARVPIRVPIYISLIIISSYIAGGAVLFTVWEKEWDFLIAAYFCFITLSTIGFGDYVFGVGKELNSNAKLVTSAAYLIMGLAIIAMCFDLMQEEVRTKCKILAMRLGLVKKSRKRTSLV